MNWGVVVEVMGYAGMALVLASFLMKNIRWLRVINMCGATLCCAYGALTKTWPTMALNGALFAINLAYLIIGGKKYE